MIYMNTYPMATKYHLRIMALNILWNPKQMLLQSGNMAKLPNVFADMRFWNHAILKQQYEIF